MSNNFYHTSDAFFDGLGKRVEQLWTEMDRDESRFRDAAIKALEESPPNKVFGFESVAMYGLLSKSLPLEQDVISRFGEPPLTVYAGRGFRVELLFWLDGLPSIHEHSFSGAFHVLSGSSIHTTWSFAEKNRLGAKLYVGCVKLETAELLEAGDTRSIRAGQSFIHATFHLDRPSITCVIRTNNEISYEPQKAYLHPSVAFAAREKNLETEKRKQLLAMLIDADRWDQYFSGMSHLLMNVDSYSAFELLLDAVHRIPEGAERNEIFLVASIKHKKMLEAIKPALVEQDRVLRVRRLRQSIKNPDLRFFLALLMNLPDRRSILSLTARRFPQKDPTDVISMWVEQLGMVVSEPALRSECVLNSVKRGDIANCKAVEALTALTPSTSLARFHLGCRHQIYVRWLLNPLFY